MDSQELPGALAELPGARADFSGAPGSSQEHLLNFQKLVCTSHWTFGSPGAFAEVAGARVEVPIYPSVSVVKDFGLDAS